MHKKFFSALLFIMIISAACHRNTVPASSSTTVTSSSTNVTGISPTMAQDILSYINQHRKAVGKSLLQMNDAVSAEAYRHSADMAAKKVPFGHDGF